MTGMTSVQRECPSVCPVCSWRPSPSRQKNCRLLMALRTSPALPEHRASSSAWTGTLVRPPLCSEEQRDEMMETSGSKRFLSHKQLTFTASWAEMLPRTFIMEVGATGLKLQENHKKHFVSLHIQNPICCSGSNRTLLSTPTQS